VKEPGLHSLIDELTSSDPTALLNGSAETSQA
jgi:hypothetical protein